MWIVDSLNGGYITSSEIDEIYKTSELEIHNFYPTLESGDRTLFVEGNYSRIINKFLPKIDGNKWDSETEKLKNEREKKLKFLQQRINIGIWGNITYPRVSKIRVKSNFTEAYINFYYPLAGYEAHLINKNGEWEIEEIILEWIV